jgi:hypothetical protein
MRADRRHTLTEKSRLSLSLVFKLRNSAPYADWRAPHQGWKPSGLAIVNSRPDVVTGPAPIGSTQNREMGMQLPRIAHDHRAFMPVAPVFGECT